MDNDFKYVCKCGEELPPSHTGPCPKCGESGQLHKAYERSAILTLGLALRANSRARQKQGFDKFKKETLQGQFPSGDPKLKNGVDKVRIIDKEKNEYHEVVENAETGEIIREVHEPLSKHRHVNPKNKREGKK